MEKSQENDIAVSVILHEVLPKHHADYERWMLDAIETHRQFDGHLGTDVIRPVERGTRYVIILRFVDERRALNWLASPVRQNLLRIAQPWLAKPDKFNIHQDNEFWFTPSTGRPQPRRWKQWMLSVLAVFPLTVFVPKQIRGLAHWAVPSLPDLAIASLSALTISGLMVYFFMPALVRLAGSWLER